MARISETDELARHGLDGGERAIPDKETTLV
jgi:hypothetical protein